MKMTFSERSNRIKQAAFYVPFTVYFAVFAIASFIGFKLLTNNEIEADTAFSDIFGLLLKVALWFSIAIISFAFSTVLISYLHLLYYKKKSGIQVKISTDVREGELHQKQTVKLAIAP